jgi:mannan endo-1,4-beta-mannosidase
VRRVTTQVAAAALVLGGIGFALVAHAPVAAAAAAPVLGASHGQLTIDGTAHWLVGVDAYELATEWGTNRGCGPMISNKALDAFFASLPRNSLVRIWADQGSMAINVRTGKLDWGPLQRVFDAAARHHVLLVPVLTQQGANCDGVPWQDIAWYSAGYRTAVIPTDAATGRAELTGAPQPNPLSYLSYVTQIVQHFRSSPALGMWEPISEPEASTCPSGLAPSGCYGHLTCPDEAGAAHALRSFFDAIGATIHRADPKHLVEDGTIGSGQCGTGGPDFSYVGASPGIDVLLYHDYYPPSVAMGGDIYNGITVREGQAKTLGKPFMAGELGVLATTQTPSVPAPNAPACVGVAERVTDVLAKLNAQFAAGTRAILVWNSSTTPLGACDYNTNSSDPLMAALRHYSP